MSITDSIFIPIYLLTIAATIFIAVFTWTSFQSIMSDTVSGGPYETLINTSMNQILAGMQSFDYVFPILVIGLLIISLIFAFKTGASIIYATLSLILWGFALMISAILSNIFELFQVNFPTMVTMYPLITYIMLNMKWLVIAWLFLVSIVMFTRNKKEEQAISAAEMVYG